MSARDIITAAGKAFGATYTEMIGEVRKGHLVRARAAATFALRARGMSYPQIGRCLKRDHSTIINYVRTYTRLLDAPEFAELVERLKAMPAFVFPELTIELPPPPPPPPAAILPIWKRKLTPREQVKAGIIDGEELNEAEFNAMLVRGSKALNATIDAQFRYAA